MQPILWRIAGQWVKRRELIEEVLQDVRVSILTSHSANVIIFPSMAGQTHSQSRNRSRPSYPHRSRGLVATFEGTKNSVRPLSIRPFGSRRNDELRVMIQAMHSLPLQQRQ